jgi:prophage antirepressor-like protein
VVSEDEKELIPFDGEVGISEFKDKPIRKVFKDGEWFFSVVDVVAAIAEPTNPRRYWSDLKRKLSAEGASELYEDFVQLKMMAEDGKERRTDAANPQTLFRIIQSIGSPKAEPFKRWLAKVAFERVQEFQNPELTIQRAMLDYQMQGHSDEWIKARIRTHLSRKELTSEWASRGVKGSTEYAILTNVISQETFNIGIQNPKNIKGLAKRHSLRDHMTDMELVLTMLGETSTAELARARDAQGFTENKVTAHAGGKIAGDARKNFERQLGRPVVSRSNFLPKRGDQGQLPQGKDN